MNYIHASQWLYICAFICIARELGRVYSYAGI